MAFGKNKNIEFKPYIDEDALQARREHIHRSIDRLGLDPDQLIIVGGAVLDAYGIRPAHDVDLAVTAQTLVDIYDNDMKTPSGISVLPHIGQSFSHVVSAAPDRRHLGVDIIANYDPSRHGDNLQAHDAMLMGELATRQGKFGKYHISTPEEIWKHYHEERRGDRRAKNDKAKVEAYLRSVEQKKLTLQR